MDMNWVESIFFGFFAGLTDVLPVSSEAHRMLFFSQETEPVLLRLLVHIAILGGLYASCFDHITRITRAYRLSKIPKRKRKRPLDMASLMDLRMLRMMVIPLIIGFFYYNRLASLISNISLLPIPLFLNGIVLFLPPYLPGSNKDSQSMTPLDALLLGLVAIASMIPGMSCVAIVMSIAMIRGADRGYALNIALLLNIPMTIGMIVYDVMAIVSVGIGGYQFMTILRFLVAAIAAFLGVFTAFKIMRRMGATIGFAPFAYYCWGAALFSFILFLSI